MKKYSIKALIGATAAVALMAVGFSFVQDGNAQVKANAADPTATITLEGASMRYGYETAGLRFGASMLKTEYESFIYPEGNKENYVKGSFEVGMLFMPQEFLDEKEELTVNTENALKLTMTWNGTLVNANNEEAADGTKVLFKGFVSDFPLEEYETGVVGRAYYRSGDAYVYSAQETKTLLEVAEAAYADESASAPTEAQKATIYNENLMPYYLKATDFSVKQWNATDYPITVKDYDTTNKSLTVAIPSLPKNESGQAEGQNAIRTNKDYAPGTYVMMEFLGKDAPGTILFGDTKDFRADNYYNAGVGLWLDRFGNGVSDCYGGHADEKAWTINSKETTTGNLYRYYLNEAYPNEKFVLVAGAEVNKTDEKKTDLQYYLYKESNGVWSLNDKGRLEGIDYTLQTGKIQVRTVINGTTATNAIIKLYQPDTLENMANEMQTVYGIDAASVKFTCTTGTSYYTQTQTTVSTNADGSYQLSMPFMDGNKYSYVATDKAYGSGTYVMAEFKGVELPGMILFGVDNLDATLTFDSAATVYTASYGWNGVGVYTEHWNKYAYSYYNSAYTARYGLFNRGGIVDGVTNGVATEDTYVLIIGAENSGNDVVLNYTLYKKAADTNELTLFDQQSYKTENASVGEGSIVFTSSLVTSGRISNLKLWSIGTKAEVDTKLKDTYTVA